MTSGRLSQAGAAFSAAHEALYLYAYPDPGTGGEPMTIGVGHTRAAGLPAVRRGDRVTIARAFEIFAADMAPVQDDVRKAFKAEIDQAQFDAACSFQLNTGAIRAGSIDDKFNRGDVAGALATWSQYNRAGGRVMKGLINRRADELALWRTGRYPPSKILVHDTATGSGRYIAASAVPWGDGEAVAAAGPVLPPITADRPLPPVVRSPVPSGAVVVGAVIMDPVEPWWRRALRLIGV
jgi:GH24 family phage-related lysozyme (muramidase)